MFVSLVGVAVLLFHSVWAAPPDSVRPQGLQVEEVLTWALEQHPDAVAARGAMAVADAQGREARTLQNNPELQAGLSVVGDLTFVQAQQPLSLGAESAFARSQARAEQERSAAEQRRAQLELAAQVRLSWAEAAAAQERLTLADEALRAARSVREAVVQRVQAGELSQLDLALALGAEAEASALLLQAQSEQAEALAQLTAYHPEAAQRGVSGPLAQAVSAAAPPTDSKRSDILAAEARVASAQAALSQARAAALPPLALGVQYQNDGGAMDLGPMFTVGLPLWSRNQTAIALANADLAYAEAALSTLQAQVEAEEALSEQRLRDAEQTHTQLQGLDEALTLGLGQVQDRFAAGELDLRDAVLFRSSLLQGQLALIESEQTLVAARVQAQLATDDLNLLPPKLAKEAP